jgi:putative NIF3 family GTP cyclohydrolase 1 type 2
VLIAMPDLSRREFTSIAAAAALAPFGPAQAQTQTPAAGGSVQALIDTIKNTIGVDWRAETWDGLKAGDPSTPVRGIVTTSLATLAVLQHAVKAGANVVVTTEPAFYARADSRTPPVARMPVHGGAPATEAAPPPTPPADRVFAAKNAFIDRHQLAIVRLNDHWRRRQPDPFVQGVALALGWNTFQSAAQPQHVDLPAATTLDALVNDVKQKLGSRGGVRVIGDAKLPVKRVGLLPGSTPIQATVAMMPNVDVILAGEVREWESVEYVRDTVFAGNKKAIVLVGRLVSEEPGMKACAAWLQTMVPADVRVTHVSAGDPYWRPAR